MGRRRGRDYIRTLSQRENYIELVRAMKEGRTEDAEQQADLLFGDIVGHARLLRENVEKNIICNRKKKVNYTRRIEMACREIKRGQVNQIRIYMPELMDYV